MAKFYTYYHRDTQELYRKALIESGHMETDVKHEADFILADWVKENYVSDMRYFNAHKIPVFIYPHSPWHSMFFYDIKPFNEEVWISGHFSFGWRQKHIMQSYGYPYPIYDIGWGYTEILPFQPVKWQKPKVLFAPNHPNTKGGVRLYHVDQENNQKAYDILVGLQKEGYLELTLRYGGALPDNGITIKEKPAHIQRSTYKQKDAIDSIMNHDVVVANQTFSWFSVALGKPTVMYATELPPHTTSGTKCRNWEVYKHLAMYPLDLFSDNPLRVLMQAGSMECTGWKEGFMAPFDKRLLLQTIEYSLEVKT